MPSSIELFNTAISDGLILTKFNLCCPDCDGPYILTNYDDFINFKNNYDNSIRGGIDVGELCCISLFLGTENWLDFVDSYIEVFPDLQHIPTAYGEAYTQCGSTSDFMFYINQLSVLLGDAVPGVNFIKFYVEEYGIIEINTMSGHSGLKFLYEFLSSTGLTQAENQQLFYIIMGNPKNDDYKKGLVIRCVNDDILISHTENYYTFIKNYYGSNIYLCLKTQRERQGTTTTYIYVNVLPEPALVNGQPFYVINYNEGGVIGKYYIFWSITNNRWEVWSAFNTITNTGTGIFHSSLLNPSLDLFLTSIDWDQQTTVSQGNVIDSSLKVECTAMCNFRSEG